MDYPKVKVCLDTSEDNLIDELYTPCLKWAERFDRGVGYFTTGWLTYNVAGLSDFASRGGKMRLITSPILSTEDTDAIIGAENQDGSAFLRLEAALLENVEILKQEMEADIIMHSPGCCMMELLICVLQFLVKSWRKETFTINLAFSIRATMRYPSLALSTTASMDSKIMKA